VAFDREYSKRDATLIRHKSGRFFRVVALGSRDGTIGCPQNGSAVQPAQDTRWEMISFVIDAVVQDPGSAAGS
jgi:hypothetical protein